jgi:hypothetical protein
LNAFRDVVASVTRTPVDFPVFHLDLLNNRVLIALVAISHVLINHGMAVGGIPLVVMLERKGLAEGRGRRDGEVVERPRSAGRRSFVQGRRMTQTSRDPDGPRAHDWRRSPRRGVCKSR